MARFATHTVGSQVLVLPKDLQYTPPTTPPANYVDELVNAKLQKLRILPSELCSDEVFLRRVTLDITGLLPTERRIPGVRGRQRPGQAGQAGRPAARAQGVLRDLGHEVGRAADGQVHERGQLQVDVPVLELADRADLEQRAARTRWCRSCSAPAAARSSNPATNYYQIETDTLKTAENVAQVFMGIRTQCAQCHNHPFDRWTMDDYYSFAAFFSQIGRKHGRGLSRDDRLQLRRRRGGAPGRRPRDGAEVPGRRRRPTSTGKDRREVLAKWLASPENPYFATSVANRVWAHFFGMGIVEPVDDVRVSNPPSNPELYPGAGQASSRSTTTTSSSWCATSATRRPTSARRSATPATRRTSRTSPTPASAASRPRTCSTASAR